MDCIPWPVHRILSGLAPAGVALLKPRGAATVTKKALLPSSKGARWTGPEPAPGRVLGRWPSLCTHGWEMLCEPRDHSLPPGFQRPLQDWHPGLLPCHKGETEAGTWDFGRRACFSSIPRWSSAYTQLPAHAPGSCGHLGSEPAGRETFSLDLPFPCPVGLGAVPVAPPPPGSLPHKAPGPRYGTTPWEATGCKHKSLASVPRSEQGFGAATHRHRHKTSCEDQRGISWLPPSPGQQELRPLWPARWAQTPRRACS